MSFAKHSIQTILVRVFLVLLGLVAGVINARWLGPEGVGIIALLLLVKDFAFRFGNLGFGSAFAFYVAQKKYSIHQILGVIWLTGSIASSIGIIILLFVWRRSFSPWNDIEPKLFYFCLLAVPLFFFNNYIQRLLSGELKIAQMNISNLVTTLSTLVLIVILVVILNMGLPGAVIAIVGADAMTFCYLLFVSQNENYKKGSTSENEISRLGLVYQLWRYGRWNYFLMFSNFFVEELPLILMKSFTADNTSVGLFSKARNIGRRSRIVAIPVARVLFPYTAASKEDYATNRTNVLCRNSLFVMMFVVMLMVLLAKPVILLLFGEAFLPSAKIFYTMAPGVALWPFAHFLGIHVAASGKPKRVFLVSLFCAVVAAVICWVLIPRYGAIGAGLSASFIYFVRVLLSMIIYVDLTGAHFTEVLFMRKSDGIYYRHIYKLLASRLKKTKRTDS